MPILQHTTFHLLTAPHSIKMETYLQLYRENKQDTFQKGLLQSIESLVFILPGCIFSQPTHSHTNAVG